MKLSWVIGAISLTILVATFGEVGGKPAVFRPSEIAWTNAPASLPAGALMAVLEGDPAAEGPFVIRFRFPDKYRIQPHWHPKTERVTVIVGTLHLGMGEKFDEAATQLLSAGTFGYWPAQMQHFAWFE